MEGRLSPVSPTTVAKTPSPPPQAESSTSSKSPASSPPQQHQPEPAGTGPTATATAATEAAAAIEADATVVYEEYDAGSDAGYATDEASRISTSISSSVRDYAFENSRRYHKFQEGRYVFPNDEPEQEREDMKHAMIVSLCNGKLHYAPLQNPRRILDVGTGTGIWAIDMGDEYPEADILGIDLSPIQPQWVPPNVRFVVDDAEAEWVYPPGSLDYVHIRHLTSSIRDWPTLLSRAYRSLRPGGWIELQELRFQLGCDDGTLREDSKVVEWFGNVKKGLAAFNIDLLAMSRNREKVIDAGFVNVDEKSFKVPIGVWPKDSKMKMVGLYHRSVVYDCLHGVSMKAFTHGLGWTPQEVEMYLIGVRKDLMDGSQHVYYPFQVVTGQKPG